MALMPAGGQDNSEGDFSSPRERIILQGIHWGIVALIIVAVFTLTYTHRLTDASATALLGTTLGHVGTSASQKLSSRKPGGR